MSRAQRIEYQSMPKEVRDELDDIKDRLLVEGVQRPSTHSDYIRVFRRWRRSDSLWKDWHKSYYLKNRDRIIGHQKRYADKNADKLREYRKNNSEKRVAKTRKWQKANKERYAKAQAEWRSANMHVIRKHIALRRAREVNATIGNPKEIAAWEKAWKALPTNICEWCRMEVPTELCDTDHAEPLVLGGAHNLDNLVIACKPCNSRKRGKPLAKWLDILGTEPSSRTSARS